MIIAGQKFASPKDTDKITVQLMFVCRNPDCTEFAGNDLKNPKADKVKFGNKNKVN
jgi:hypothetical protein